MLAHQWHSSRGIPVVFLHGLLGSQQDWAAVVARFQAYPQFRPLTLDLPFHGKSAAMTCHHFDSARQQLQHTLQHLLGDMPFWLVGYSLGGRLALDFALNGACASLQGVIVEGTNIGLTNETEKQQRWQNDCRWAQRFRTEPLEQVLADWYQQPVFADLTAEMRNRLIRERAQNHGAQIADMLEATSLAKQPWLLPPPNAAVTFLIGERDTKFRALAQQYGLNHRLISQAGHNAHRDNPTAFVEQVVQILQPG